MLYYCNNMILNYTVQNLHDVKMNQWILKGRQKIRTLAGDKTTHQIIPL